MVASRQIRGAILPWEKQLIDTLGLTIEEYNWYANEVANYRPERDPAYDVVPHVVCDPITVGIVTTVVGIAASVAAQALAPKPKLPRQTDPAQQQQQEQRGADVSGASVSGSNRFTNVDGFTSVQPLARLGESMQLVFANRRNNYGGVRVETKLLWSQLLSQGDGQELLAIFLANGGELASQPDFDGMGIGDSLLRGYQASKLAIYFRNGGPLAKRIDINNRIVPPGVNAADLLQPRNTSDVFLAELKTLNNPQPIFSGVRIPSTMSIFGISEPLRNGQHWQLPFKRVRVINPPEVVFQFNFELYANDQKEYNKKVATVEEAARERRKTLSFYAPRTGLIAARNAAGTLLAQPANQQWLDLDIAIGDTIEFDVYVGNSPNLFGDIGNQDIAAKEDSIREAIDDVIIVGETYLVAGVEAVCVGESTNNLWNISGSNKKFTFKATQAGKTRLVNEGIVINEPVNNIGGPNQFLSQINPSSGPTVCKLAIAHFTTTRKLNQVEIGIKSQVFKRFNGIANFASIPSDLVLNRIESGGNNFNVGTYSEYGLRYSFFRVEVKEKGATEWYNLNRQAGAPFCVKGRTPVSQFNFIRLAFPDLNKQYEVRFRPIAGGAYLAYNHPLNNPVCVLDARTGSPQEYPVSTPIGVFILTFKGYSETINNIDATNDVLFLRGKPPGGNPQKITPSEFDSSVEISDQIYDGQLDGGNGGYVKIPKVFSTSGGTGTGLTVNVLALQRSIATPVGEIVIGLQTRWLHQGIMGAKTPQSEGEEFTSTVRFRRGSYFVDARFTLRAMTFAGYATYLGLQSGRLGTGYGTDNDDEGWKEKLLWVNLSRFPSVAQPNASPKVTIINFDGFDLDNDGNPYVSAGANGSYIVEKPDGFPTPNNNRVEAEINITYASTNLVYRGTISIKDAGSSYTAGDIVTIVNLANAPKLALGAVTAPGFGANILEPFDAIADVYMNDGQEGSHQNGPEHAIVYINEQRENIKLDSAKNPIKYAPEYKDMTLLGLQLRSGKEWSSFNNFTYYAKQGCKVRKIVNAATGNAYDDPVNANSTAIYDASNLYPEILYHLVAKSSLMPTSMIDWNGFAEGCKVCLANNFYWDGVLSAPVNIRDWGHENAQYFFLDFLVLGGKLSLQPTFPVNKGSDLSGYTLGGAYDRKPVISALFTDGNIIEDSLSVNWYPAEQRKAPQVLVTMRDEVENGFAETRNILVKRIDPANPDPQVEAIDFTGFCTSADHAIKFAKLLINMRYHITHVISFKTLPNGLALQPGQYFRVSSQARHVERFQNGYVLQDGTVVSSSPMAAGTYDVYFWRSDMTKVESRSMAINANGKTTGEFANSVFTQYSSSTSNRLYKAEMIAYDEEGMVEITGSHVPVEADGKITYLNMDATLFEVQNEQ